ncbi:SoxR reducing system RseC family protein [Clostridium aminobutyricum]|uniref:SoxR reducing system RseC family protein n=1 Tax=Clostridium aminobutyricum TaxID=33953 RepID=A0A939D7C1_CLOAM|nr:SoxR reducing system RseC family protein [Clostridium aminobutyricum]MBN7772415.1 SoxR reducing system RseC family protein [Clostridium aminobutyricum]
MKYKFIDANTCKGGCKVSKEEDGIIIETCKENMAKVKLGRHNDCKNCGACPGDNTLIIEAQNLIGAKSGQRVILEVKETNMLVAAFVVYIVPLLAILAGVMIGHEIAVKLGYSIQSFEIGGGIFAFLLSVLNIKVFDKFAHNSKKMQPTITRISS